MGLQGAKVRPTRTKIEGLEAADIKSLWQSPTAAARNGTAMRGGAVFLDGVRVRNTRAVFVDDVRVLSATAQCRRMQRHGLLGHANTVSSALRIPAAFTTRKRCRNRLVKATFVIGAGHRGPDKSIQHG